MHFAKKSGHEQAFRNRALTKGIVGDTIGGVEKRTGPMTKNEFRASEKLAQQHRKQATS